MNMINVLQAPTKYEAAQRVGLKKYDSALPQQWLEEFVNVLARSEPRIDRQNLYEICLSSFVWSYDRANVFGAPAPLTIGALGWLKTYDSLMGTQYAHDDCTVFNILTQEVQHAG